MKWPWRRWRERREALESAQLVANALMGRSVETIGDLVKRHHQPGPVIQLCQVCLSWKTRDPCDVCALRRQYGLPPR